MTDVQNAHVIIVEDDRKSMIAITKLLYHIGIRNCDCYPSGRAVVAFVRMISNTDAGFRPNLILLDIGLPGEDGYAVLRDLRRDPILKGTRVVAVTARASREEMARAQAAGFDGFISKPLDLARFPGQVLRILAGEGVWEV